MDEKEQLTGQHANNEGSGAKLPLNSISVSVITDAV